MCKEGSNWDDDINNDRKAVWKKWLLSAQETPNIVIPRCYFQKEKPVEFQIIGYCDASEKKYSGVTYLIKIHKYHHKLLLPKRELVLLKCSPYPHLELKSSLLLARLIDSVYSALSRRFAISKVLCLINSAITLA